MYGRRGGKPHSFSIGWAIGLSVLIHLLLMLVTVWFPMSFHSAATAEVEQEDRITFSFAEADDSLEDRILEEPPPAPTEPAPEIDIPEQVRPETLPTPPVEESLPLEDVPEQVEPEPLDDAAVPEDLPHAEESTSDDGSPAETVAEPPRAGRTGRLDVRKALADFKRASTAVPPRQQPPSPTDVGNRGVFVPDFSQVPMSGFGVGGLQFESRDYDWSDYGRQVYMAIWRAWHNRLWMTTDDFEKWAYNVDDWFLEDQTQVRFVIERSGQVTGIVQEAASECLPLDASALDALAEVILPPLPADFPRDREVVRGLFITDLHVREMRTVLGRYKRMGLF